VTTTLKPIGMFYVRMVVGEKTSTIRKGKRNEKVGDKLTFHVAGEEMTVEVTSTEEKEFSQLTLEDALKDGFDTLEELKEAMKFHYPDVEDTDTVTIINFKLKTFTQTCGSSPRKPDSLHS